MSPPIHKQGLMSPLYRALVGLLLLLLFLLPAVLGLGDNVDRACLHSGNMFLDRNQETVTMATGRQAYILGALFKASNRLNFSAYREPEQYNSSDTVVRRLVQEFLGKAFHQNATPAESAHVIARVNEMYSENVAKVGLPRFFAALRIALSNCTGDP